MSELTLQPYIRIPVVLAEWDPALPAVAAALLAAVRRVVPGVLAEHVGSSAVPGMAGKNYVDLLLAPQATDIPAAAAALVAAGWQRQTEPWAFPPTRPMLRAAVRYEATTYRSHLHIVPAGDPEVDELIGFRDALRADEALRRDYAARKREVLRSGRTDMLEYAEAKADTVVAALQRLGLRPIGESS